MSSGSAFKISQYQRPVNLLEIAERKQASETKPRAEGTFKEMFSREMAGAQGVNFSRHASQRLYSRGINLSEETLGKISDAIDKAADKGSRETLILSDEVALVVAVKERTVVTAFDRNNLREGIVTKIDSAIIL